MEDKKFIVTIDGSAWTGKSTVAKALADLLGYQYLNTGYMFRSVGYLALRNGISLDDKDSILKVLKESSMKFSTLNNSCRIFVDGVDLTDEIKTNEIITSTSRVAQIPEVRGELLKIQREIAKDGGFVVEGRDTGTAVFPDAEWKFYLDASMEIKVKRFLKTLPDKDKEKYPLEEIRNKIQDIDERDKNRLVGPLRRAEDALIYDNSLSPNAEMDAVVLWNYILHKEQIIENSEVLRSIHISKKTEEGNLDSDKY